MDEFFKEYGTDSATLIIKRLVEMLQAHLPFPANATCQIATEMADKLQEGLRKQYG